MNVWICVVSLYGVLHFVAPETENICQLLSSCLYNYTFFISLPLPRCVSIFTCPATASAPSVSSGKVKDVLISFWTWRAIRATTGRWERSPWATSGTFRSCLRARWAEVQRVTSAWMTSLSHQGACSPPQRGPQTTLLHLPQVCAPLSAHVGVIFHPPTESHLLLDPPRTQNNLENCSCYYLQGPISSFFGHMPNTHFLIQI